ncbi:hypothetical protein BKA70DRAFT_1146617 [Coprinopsis sp. MPI-PUGE-AT-0042]|nr:hypothetical protein BKA70DRAFT_1146617 [Coprinopsis sp. MPI-PUGE-AT-0042]
MGDHRQHVATRNWNTDVVELGFHRPGQTTVLNQSLSNVNVTGGDIHVVGGDYHHHHHQHEHYHQHYHRQNPRSDDISGVLARVPNYRDLHIANLSRATTGTGPCFSQWDEFSKWTGAQSVLKTMWGSGMPGAGKTIFAAIVINEVESRAQESDALICVGFIYFRYSDHTMATVRDFLEVLVKQTIERHSNCLPIFNEVYARHVRERSRPSEADLLHLLDRFTEVMESTFYFLEALDEAPSDIQLDILKKLSSLDVKLFVTSRPLPFLYASLPGIHRFTILAQDRDLDLHISKEISRGPVLQSIVNQGGPVLRQKIVSTLKQKCGGMFLHASLQLDALWDCTSVSDVEKTLEDFPHCIEDVYQRTWNRICDETPSRRRLAQHVLIWVLCARRSLKIEELRHLLATCPSTHNFDPTRLVDEGILIGLCRGLVNVEEETEFVRFVHYTAKDVVERFLSATFCYPHSLPTLVCLSILAESGFQNTTLRSENDLAMALLADPLLAYAHKAWSAHAHESLHDTHTAQKVAHFVQGCSAFPVVVEVDTLWDRFDHLKPLHMVVYFDFPIHFAGPANLQDPNGLLEASPLILAILRESPRAVKELLALPRILINRVDESGYTPLMWALRRNNNHAIVALLLTHPNIDVNMHSLGYPPLLKAAINDAGEAAALLLAHPKIEPNHVSQGRTALMLASRHGSSRVVRVLLADPRVMVNVRTTYLPGGETALDMARLGASTTYFDAEKKEAYEDIVRLLSAHWEMIRLLRLPLHFLRVAVLPSTQGGLHYHFQRCKQYTQLLK